VSHNESIIRIFFVLSSRRFLPAKALALWNRRTSMAGIRSNYRLDSRDTQSDLKRQYCLNLASHFFRSHQNDHEITEVTRQNEFRFV